MDKSFASYIFVISDKHVVHKRAVYNILDLIGDVGGLFDGLKYIASVFFSFISLFWNEPFYMYLMTKMY